MKNGEGTYCIAQKPFNPLYRVEKNIQRNTVGSNVDGYLRGLQSLIGVSLFLCVLFRVKEYCFC